MPSADCQVANRVNRPQAIVLVAALCIALCTRSGLGDERKPKLPTAVRKDAEKMRKAVEANFQAINEEKLRDLLATCAKAMPAQQEFAAEAKALFEDTDVYMRLADFELIEYRPQFAAARIVQITLPADEKDRTSGTNQQIFYRGNSALLPDWECCEYVQTFVKEGGKWKLYMITERPKPREWAND